MWLTGVDIYFTNTNNKLYLDTISREETLFKRVYSWYIGLNNC